MKNKTDIWNAFREGDDEALSEIYQSNVQALYHFGKIFCNDHDLIKDAIQEVFLCLINSREKIGQTDNIRFYLMKSIRRQIFRLLKENNKNLSETSLSYKYLSTESVEDMLILDESKNISKDKLDESLKKISPRQREILIYRYKFNLSYDEICFIMSLKYDSARKMMTRAVQSVRAMMV